jgi:hypothetical protein
MRAVSVFVMPGPHDLSLPGAKRTWMAGTSPAMTIGLKSKSRLRRFGLNRAAGLALLNPFDSIRESPERQSRLTLLALLALY